MWLNETIIKTIKNEKPENNIPKKNMINLVKSATGCLFQHNKPLYTQVDGFSMSNPLASILANFFMGILETTLFSQEDKNNPVLCIPTFCR